MKDNQAKYPQLRFKGFTDPWEERKLKDVVEKQIKGKAQFEKLAPGEVEYLDTSRLNGGQAILTNGLKDVTLDDILILWDGSKAGTVYHGFEGALGSTLKAYRTSANSKFVYQYLKRHQDNIYNNYRTPNIPHVQKDFLNVFTISVPVSDEQEKIASFFKQLDDTIALHQRKLAKLKELKQGYLQKLFPKNGSKFPQLRFAGFADAWEKRKLGSVFNYEQPTPYIVNSENYNDQYPTPVLTAGKSLVLGYTDENEGIKLASKHKPVIIFDDFTTSSHLIDFPFKVKSSAMKILSTSSDSDDVYFSFGLLSNLHYEPKNHERHWISQFSAFKVQTPSTTEQKRIGKTLLRIDDLIAATQCKLDLLKKLKKGYLQKMFC